MKEFERRLRVQDAVIKFLTVRIDETLKRLEKRKKEREKRAHRRPQAAVPQPSLAQQMMGGRRKAPIHCPARPLPATGPAHLQQLRPSALPALRAEAVESEGKEISPWLNKEVEDRSPLRSAPPAATKPLRSAKKQYFRRKKVCRFCVEKIDDINYKDVRMLQGVHRRARQDRSAPHFRRLRAAPAPPDGRHSEGAQHRPAAVRGRSV